jgi:uncharacterized protein YdhG (YjbR/CyaY superfamily)
MTVTEEYIAHLNEPEKTVIENMYSVVRQTAPGSTEGFSYGMPAFKYKGKGLVAVMANNKFLSIYPFGAVGKLGLDLSEFECTSGSIHFSVENPVTDELLRQIVTSRMRQIDA